MALARFRFERESSAIFGQIYRPLARVELFSLKTKEWEGVDMVVDSGADYTLLPRFYAQALGVNIKGDCLRYETAGIGGSETIYLLKRKHPVRLGSWKGQVPIGFLNRDDVPPLLGRQGFMERLRVVFDGHVTSFHQPRRKRNNS